MLDKKKQLKNSIHTKFVRFKAQVAYIDEGIWLLESIIVYE